MAKHAGFPAGAVLMDVVRAAGLNPDDVGEVSVEFTPDRGTQLLVRIFLNEEMKAVLQREAVG